MVCYKACTYLHISYGEPFLYKVKNGTNPCINFYFGTSVAVLESHLKYDGTTLFAEIGGYTGLLLGVSLLDVCIAFRFIYTKILNLQRNRNDDNDGADVVEV